MRYCCLLFICSFSFFSALGSAGVSCCCCYLCVGLNFCHVLCLNLSCLLELFRYRFWFCQWLGRFYYVCHLILTFVIFFTCSLLNFNDTSKLSLVSWLLLLLFFLLRVGGGGGGIGMFFKKKFLFVLFLFFDGKSVMPMFCNAMLLLLYVHVCVTRTGWKTRPRPKTVILLIKQSINQSINQSLSLSLSLSPSLPPSLPTSSLA